MDIARPDDREPQTADERYEIATNTGDLTLRVAELPDGSPDVLMAAAWSERRMGAVLLRLAAQWAAEKPQRQEPRSIKSRMGEGMTRDEATADFEEERAALAKSYGQQIRWLVGRLHELAAVREQLAIQAVRWGMGRPQDPAEYQALLAQRRADAAMLRQLLAAADKGGEEAIARLEKGLQEVRARREADELAQRERVRPLAAAVVRFWLDQTCRVCQGRMYRLIGGTPMLSSQVCPRPPGGCGGTGKAPIPYGEDGRRLASYLDQCQFRAKQGIRDKLRGRRERQNLSHSK